MSNPTFQITPKLISDYVADRLDDEDARIVKEAIEHYDRIALAVAAARQVNSRMSRSLAHDATKFEPQGSRTLSDTIVAALDRDSGLRREHLRKRWQGVARRLRSG